MSPTERIKVISARLAERARAKRSKVRPAHASARRIVLERQESRRAEWAFAIRAHRGLLTDIAWSLGCDRHSAKRAVRALGLWEMLAEARRLAGRRPLKGQQ